MVLFSSSFLLIQKTPYSKANVNITANNGDTALMHAAYCDLQTMVPHLIQARADINAVGYGGWTVLHWAAWNGSKAVVEQLLHAKADTTIICNGQTTAQLARRYGNAEVAKLLDAAHGRQ